MTTLDDLLERLGRLAEASAPPSGDTTIDIDSVVVDSRAARPGALFAAIRGQVRDGHDHVADAADRGAVAALVDHVVDAPIPQLVVADTRLWTGLLAAALYDVPSRALDVVGVTGTNGKTSIVTLVEHLAESCGRRARSMGTLTGALTTAAAPDFQGALRQMADDGVEVVAAEVSSHALDQHRVAGTEFAVALFTNLTQDHLDYHPDMEHYYAAKARLFEQGRSARAVIDVSDPWGARLADEVTIPVVAVDTRTVADAATLGPSGTTFTWRGRPVEMALGGRFSVANALLAAEACVELGLDIDDVADALGSAPQIPGRFELVDAGQPFSVIVDYSHTPASITAVIDSARELASGALIVVFGAGGDRDATKRAPMGAAASAADRIVVTSDNPRSEDPQAIIDDILVGVPDGKRSDGSLEVIIDRSAAIHAAIASACEGDVVVIAGKGHENYQIIGNETRDFDDRVEARRALLDSGWDPTS